jgi:hypothetical protein
MTEILRSRRILFLFVLLFGIPTIRGVEILLRADGVMILFFDLLARCDDQAVAATMRSNDALCGRVKSGGDRKYLDRG